MAVLETIRVKFGIVITVLIAVALLSFIIDPTTLQSVSSSMSSKYDVGDIDGKAISYNDFQAEVEKFTQSMRFHLALQLRARSSRLLLETLHGSHSSTSIFSSRMQRRQVLT